MIKAGDFIMNWHRIYVVKSIINDRWIMCDKYIWSATELKLLIIRNEATLISEYKYHLHIAKNETHARINTVHEEIINLMIRFVFEYTEKEII